MTTASTQLREKLRLHALWLEKDPKGRRANFSGANLSWENLREANLQGAYFYKTNLFAANLREAVLLGAHFRKVDLRGASLSEANLQGAKLHEVDLSGSDLWGASLLGVNLQGVKTGYANRWANAFFFKGACQKALQWIEQQNLEDLAELTKICPNPSWAAWLKAGISLENPFW